LQKELSATCIGSLAAYALRVDSGSEIVGEVVSVFPSSLYIRTTNRELVFVTGRQLKSPITLNVDSRTDFSQIVRPQDRVSASESGVCFGESLSIGLSGATTCETQTTPHVHKLAITSAALHLASLILMIIDNDQSILDQSAFAHAGASKFVSDGVLPSIRTNDMSALLSAAQKVVGLGTGFTPSGDDLLGGFLATYHWFTPPIDWRRIDLSFEALEKRTHWVSAKLLDYMQRQILDEQVNAIIESATLPDDDSFLLAFQTLLPRGHTSGIDILVGALLAFGLIHDIATKDNTTSMVAKNLRLAT